MNTPPNYTDEKLLDLIDGILTSDEEKALKNAMKNNTELKARYHDLLAADKFLQKMSLESPSANFSQKVMTQVLIDKLPFRKGGVLLVLSGIITVIAGSLFIMQNMIDIGGITTLKVFGSFKIDSLLPDSVNLKIINLTLLTILSLVALVLLDKVILRPLFHNRSA